MPPVYNSRAPGAINFIPREAPAAGAPAPAVPVNQFVSGMPAAGSPLMAALVKYVQSRNPAMVINEGNVQANMPAVLDQRPGTPFRIPGRGRELLAQLAAAGLGRIRGVNPYPYQIPAGSALSDLPAHWQASIGELGANSRGVGELGLAQAGQPSISGGGVSAPPMVPVNTLPAPPLPPPAPAPIAQTPVGPMFYPPGTTNVLFGSRDPRRR